MAFKSRAFRHDKSRCASSDSDGCSRRSLCFLLLRECVTVVLACGIAAACGSVPSGTSVSEGTTAPGGVAAADVSPSAAGDDERASTSGDIARLAHFDPIKVAECQSTNEIVTSVLAADGLTTTLRADDWNDGTEVYFGLPASWNCTLDYEPVRGTGAGNLVSLGVIESPDEVTTGPISYMDEFCPETEPLQERIDDQPDLGAMARSISERMDEDLVLCRRSGDDNESLTKPQVVVANADKTWAVGWLVNFAAGDQELFEGIGMEVVLTWIEENEYNGSILLAVTDKVTELVEAPVEMNETAILGLLSELPGAGDVSRVQIDDDFGLFTVAKAFRGESVVGYATFSYTRDGGMFNWFSRNPSTVCQLLGWSEEMVEYRDASELEPCELSTPWQMPNGE